MFLSQLAFPWSAPHPLCRPLKPLSFEVHPIFRTSLNVGGEGVEAGGGQLWRMDWQTGSLLRNYKEGVEAFGGRFLAMPCREARWALRDQAGADGPRVGGIVLRTD